MQKAGWEYALPMGKYPEDVLSRDAQQDVDTPAAHSSEWTTLGGRTDVSHVQGLIAALLLPYGGSSSNTEPSRAGHQ